MRTGSTAAYTDTTDTAANIIAAYGGDIVYGTTTFLIRIKNATAFPETLSAGTGVTLPSTTVIGPFSTAYYYATITSATAVTLTHLSTNPIADSISLSSPTSTALSTVGAGTITAAAIAGGLVTRTGSQSNTAFTDTTDTAANIIAAQPATQGRIGSSFYFTYENTTNASATITGGTGVTTSGITVVPGNTAATFLATYTAAATMTIVGISITVPSAPNGTVVANGVTAVVVADTRITANSVIVFTLKTIGGTPAAPFCSAVTAGTGFSMKSLAGDTSTYSYLIIN